MENTIKILVTLFIAISLFCLFCLFPCFVLHPDDNMVEVVFNDYGRLEESPPNGSIVSDTQTQLV